MKNSTDLGGCYPPRPSASVDNTLLDQQNSSYPTHPHSIIAKYYAHILYGLLTSRWLDIGQVLFFACLWTKTELRSINSQKKKEQDQYPAILTKQAWSIKGLVYGFLRNFSCGTRWVSPEWAR